MAGQKLKSARAIAVEVLNKCDPVKNYAGQLLDRLQHETNQRQRATDLVFGTLRNRRAIDAVIATFSGRPIERIQGRLLNIIRIGTYELIYCPSTEQYAIVSEAVLNCRGGSRTARTDKQAGFVNAVLRQITRHISNRQVTLAQADAGRTLPHPSTPLRVKSLHAERRRGTTGSEPRGIHCHKSNVVYGCEFDTSFLPEQESCPAAYLSTVFSLPEWLVAGWLAEFGEESTRRICLASNRRPGLYIRPNPLKTTIEALTEKFTDAEIGFEIVAIDDGGWTTHDGRCSMIRIKSPRDVTQLPGFADGQFTVQDITASKPVRLLNPQPGWTILDLCAAPGTKTTQLAEATDDAAKIIATDIDSWRLEMVKENIARLGLKCVDVVPYDELQGIFECRMPIADFQIENRKPKIENPVDCVLLDVPCSNTGVLAKRIEVRYRIEPKAIKELSGLQAELLRDACGLVRTGGKICYSTCSIQKCENSEIIEKFLEENKNFTLESQRLTLPEAEGMDHDGGYAAILVKRKA
ncbi:MAG TPA: transcription antitermination factor NusB [Sedimentisphaerales bacterium]|nr:transcription antitermination factor NusB [Sedimentisphaerales bacterium]